MNRQEYINHFSNAVIRSVDGTGIFPSIKMAQAILESSDSLGNSGESKLARYFNNHFGIKADRNWKGRKAYFQTREVVQGKAIMVDAPFRVYTDPADSFKDHTRFLRGNERYRNAGVFSAAAPEIQAQALEKAGYATDPLYAEKLISLIDKHNLRELDRKMVKNAVAA